MKNRILFISSTGGHFTELMKLKKLFDKYEYHIVTEKTKTNTSLKEKYGKKIDFLVYGTKKNPIVFVFKFLYNTIKSFFIFFKFNPDAIISTGAHTAGPMCVIAKIFGKKIIYIETFANITTKTVTGKIVYNFADVFVVQWEEMLKLYPNAKYFGGGIF